MQTEPLWPTDQGTVNAPEFSENRPEREPARQRQLNNRKKGNQSLLNNELKGNQSLLNNEPKGNQSLLSRDWSKVKQLLRRIIRCGFLPPSATTPEQLAASADAHIFRAIILNPNPVFRSRSPEKHSSNCSVRPSFLGHLSWDYHRKMIEKRSASPTL